jgi:hypothetical protein
LRNPLSGVVGGEAASHREGRECRKEQEKKMLRIHSWIYRFGLLAALVLAASAGKKWGG